MGTLRQDIVQMLQNESLDAWQLANYLGIHEKELLAHLPYVVKSVASRGGRFTVSPAYCLNCGFEFKERRRLSPPGKCPKCKQARIHGPWYRIQGRGARTESP